jgi:hypothetical protein
MKNMDDSAFNMWRAAIAVTQADGKITESEQKWIDQKLANLPFSQEQRDIIHSDIHNGINFEEAYSKITNAKNRAFLIHLIRTLGHIDQDFSSEEKEIYKRTQDKVLKNINLNEHQETISEMENQSYKTYKRTNPDSIFEHIFIQLEKILDIF